jgi:hypothetical protein
VRPSALVTFRSMVSFEQLECRRRERVPVI